MIRSAMWPRGPGATRAKSMWKKLKMLGALLRGLYLALIGVVVIAWIWTRGHEPEIVRVVATLISVSCFVASILLLRQSPGASLTELFNPPPGLSRRTATHWSARGGLALLGGALVIFAGLDPDWWGLPFSQRVVWEASGAVCCLWGFYFLYLAKRLRSRADRDRHASGRESGV
jgi:hypothetical protein